jgi:CopG family nickel-responsive transcriptional regulator
MRFRLKVHTQRKRNGCVPIASRATKKLYKGSMQRITISLDGPLAEAFDALTAEQGYASRSEAVRDLVRAAVDGRTVTTNETGECMAVLSYVYDHHQRALVMRLLDLSHDHHELIISTTHVHLDHDSCLESMMLRGPAAQVRTLADRVRAERGVRLGTLNIISAAAAGTAHDAMAHATPASRAA